MDTTANQKTSENEGQQHLEIAEAVHKEYYAERLRQGKKPGEVYSKLDEATKEYYRATVRAVLTVLEKQKESQITNEISAILHEADKALIAGRPVVAHSGMRLAITELTATS